MTKVDGHKYGLEPQDFLRQNTVTEDKDEIDEDRTFFCSELVAKAYKMCGIIVDDDVSCTRYLPGHFSDSSDRPLKLTEGTFIEQDR